MGLGLRIAVVCQSTVERVPKVASKARVRLLARVEHSRIAVAVAVVACSQSVVVVDKPEVVEDKAEGKPVCCDCKG